MPPKPPIQGYGAAITSGGTLPNYEQARRLDNMPDPEAGEFLAFQGWGGTG